jgi:membrane protease subunit (stomatin/prohibitin family)
MGLWDKIVGEFIDVVEWTDDSSDTLVYRFPTYNKEIQMGSSLIVRESQIAVFVYRGQIADVFEPGHYKLATANMPLMTTLQHWTHGFNSPFKSEVYYFNTRQYTDLKWGTPNPITLRDAEFGVLRVRAFGSYSMRVKDPERMMREISGTEERYTVSQIENQIRAAIITRFTDHVASSKVPFLDYAANLNEFSSALVPTMSEELDRFGLGLETFFVQNVSLPPEVEKLIDKRAGMAALGDMDQYTKFQMAEAIPMAASAGGDGGMAGAGIGAGMGMAMGSAMANSLGGGMGGQAPAAPVAAAAPVPAAAPKVMIRCGKCNNLCEEDQRFCGECGNKMFAD